MGRTWADRPRLPEDVGTIEMAPPPPGDGVLPSPTEASTEALGSKEVYGIRSQLALIGLLHFALTQTWVTCAYSMVSGQHCKDDLYSVRLDYIVVVPVLEGNLHGV